MKKTNTLFWLIFFHEKGEIGHATGHLELLEPLGDPATNLEIGSTHENLKSAIAGETHVCLFLMYSSTGVYADRVLQEYTDMYPGMAKTAREEGFEGISEWFETLAMAEKSHAGRFQVFLSFLSHNSTFSDFFCHRKHSTPY